MDKIFQNIVDHGTYYEPAWDHYGHKTSVKCDRCNRTNLIDSRGWTNYDLCMRCVNEIISKTPSNLPRLTKMMQKMYDPVRESGNQNRSGNLSVGSVDTSSETESDSDEYIPTNTRVTKMKQEMCKRHNNDEISDSYEEHVVEKIKRLEFDKSNISSRECPVAKMKQKMYKSKKNAFDK